MQSFIFMNLINFFLPNISYNKGFDEASASVKKSSPTARKFADISHNEAQHKTYEVFVKKEEFSKISLIFQQINTKIKNQIKVLKEEIDPKKLGQMQEIAKSVEIACLTLKSLKWLSLEQRLSIEKRIADLNLIKSKLDKADQIPRDGIKVGLPNFGNTCWLNTTLKFIACTTYYDQMLIDIPPKGLEELQKLLKNVIYDLRRGKGGILSHDKYKNLLNELQKKVPFKIGPQNDAPEFLLLLTDKLDWKPAKPTFNPQELEERNSEGIYPREAQVYVSKKPGVIKYGFEQHSQTQLNIDIAYRLKSPFTQKTGKIELSENETEEVSDIYANIFPSNQPIKQAFIIYKAYTALPQTLMLNLKRSFNDDKGRPTKADNPLKLDEDGCITLTEYSLIKDKDGHITGMKPSSECRYRIGASMTHIGGPHGGHFVCEERAADTTQLIHSDAHIYRRSGKGLGVQGYFIRFDRISQRKL